MIFPNHYQKVGPICMQITLAFSTNIRTLYFDYGCSSWFLLINKNLKLTLQKAQNKCICFCLNLLPRFHIDPSHIRKSNWIPAGDRVDYCIANTRLFKHWNGIVSGYIHEMFKPSLCRHSTRSQMTLAAPLLETNTG